MIEPGDFVFIRYDETMFPKHMSCYANHAVKIIRIIEIDDKRIMVFESSKYGIGALYFNDSMIEKIPSSHAQFLIEMKQPGALATLYDKLKSKGIDIDDLMN